MSLFTQSFWRRLATALLLLPFVITALYFGGLTLLLVISLMFALSLWEWFRLALVSRRAKKHIVPSVLVFSQIILGFAAFYLLGWKAEFHTLMAFMFSVWSSDSCAYIFGKVLGGPKMAPKISPNKTWAGLAGAVLAPAAMLLGFYQGLYLEVALTGILIGLTGQAGDLCVSQLKRKSGVKDTGKFFPGHGGVLDRLDAMLLAAPVFVVFCLMMGLVRL